MKLLFLKSFFIVTCLFFAYTGHAQSAIDEVVNGMRANRVTMLNKYLDNIVLVTINNQQNTYSRTQTGMVLKDFLSKNPPLDLAVINNGTTDNNGKFAICDLTTANTRYYLYILVRQKENGAYVVQELRLNKQ